VYDAQYSGGTNQATLEIVTGTPAPSPVLPAAPNNTITLAQISVAANATSVVNANILDLRTLYTRNSPVPTPLTYTANGSVTAAQAAGARALHIEGCNGGGGAGGTAATGAATVAVGTSACGAPSAIKTIATAGLTFPLQVNVGAAGAGGAAGANNGGVGGQSSVKDNNGAGSTLWTPGTNDGSASAGYAGTAGGAGGTLGGGYAPTGSSPVADVTIPGTIPNDGMRVSTTQPYGSSGGSSAYGNGGFRGINVSGGGAGYGGGGGSTVAGNNQAAIAGSPGGAGLVIITPIY
jgi:hypothetical protein